MNGRPLDAHASCVAGVAGGPRVFFDSWESVGRVLVSGVFAYAAVVVFLRISGKRTLAKMNAFDFVVTVAIGSTLATTLTSNTVPIVNGVVALGLLIALQYVIAFGVYRSRWFETIVKSRPASVFRRGEFDAEALRAERLTRDEVLMAIRREGIRDLDEVHMVVLETDGSLSVITGPPESARRSSTENVRG